MKPDIKIFSLLMILTTSCLVLPRQTEAQQTNVTFQVFYDELSPYGQWINYGNYGYVWIPDVESDFVPYSTDGNWIMTDYGWTWASDYNWGWAAFHYGRWSFTDSFGWFWVPDNQWGPAWVNWRQADGYYGWSPMEPGVTISMSIGGRYDSNYDHWMFVRDRDFDRPNINQYYVNSDEQYRIARNSVVINNTYNDNNRHTTYVTGPSRNDIQNATGRRIVPLTVQNNNRPGKEINNGRLQIYRPQIENNNNNDRRAVPTRITNQNEVKQRQANQNANPSNMQDRPANRVIPNNNNSQTIPQRNDNNQQNRTTQSGNERKIQTIEPARSIPADNNVPDRRSNVVVPQNNPQPVQQRNVNEQNNNVPVRRPEVVTPQNNPQPAQQRDVNPANNIPRQQNTPPAKVGDRPQTVQPQRVNPANNNRPVNQPKSAKQEIKKTQEKIPDKVPESR